MKNLTDKPVHPHLKDDLWLESKQKRLDILHSVASQIVLLYVDMEAQLNSKEEYDDKVQGYACEILSHGLLYLEFSDGIREGDGFRILRCWRFLMLVFKASRHKNYSIEALNLLCQYHFFLSPRQAQQLLWSRCINTHGVPGCNIPADLFMEHLNRICKLAVVNLGANKTPSALERIGKSLGVL